ncbi:MAG: DUF4416 family protein [Acidobacteria bacterium]|nr:DUF4416 family protein [Acidobacteriota bacterium]
MPAPRVKLILAAMIAEGESIPRCQEILAGTFGPLEVVSEPFFFRCSDSYRREMGPNLRKFLVACEPLRGTEEMVAVKRTAVRLEEERRRTDGGRRWNLDPGYLDADRFLLTSRKEAAHRIWVGEGVWAEITLLYSRGRYRPLPWTYPDYRLDLVSGFLRKVRSRFLRQVRPEPAGSSD